MIYHIRLAMEFYDNLGKVLSEMPGISLDEMSGVRLMNRTDTKYLANKSLLLKFFELAKNDYFVQKIDGSPVAEYNTTYWDTPDHRFYLLHHDGIRPRIKVRVRTYIDSALSFLEIKNKDNHNKTRKKRRPLASPEAIDTEENEEFLINKAAVGIEDIHPCLKNNFKRITLVNKNRTERLTIDYDLSFYNIETDVSMNMGNLVIIELKREGRSPSPALNCLLKLRIKPQGFSKYCIGTYLTNKNIKGNMFKDRIPTIKKLV